MATGNTYLTDLYAINNFVQNTLVSHPKAIFIETLRDAFAQDSYYHYTRDPFGFPKTPDHTDLSPSAGIEDDDTTRLFIGEYYRFDVKYHPAILVKSAGSRYVPISFNQNIGTIIWANTKFIDGYGNTTTIATPNYFKEAGAWEGQISVEIETRSSKSRDELVELVSILLINKNRLQLQNAGVCIKGVSQSAPSESEDRNDKLFNQSITFDIRSEWRREIPINSIIDAINICVDFGNVETTPMQPAPNIRINSNVELLDALIDL
jgi:hypothetical protein